MKPLSDKFVYGSVRFMAFSAIAYATLICLVALTVQTGCKSPARTTHTTLESIGVTTDIAVREYLDGVIQKRYKTNGFPEVMRSYGYFQTAYSNSVWIAANTTNKTQAIPPMLAVHSKNTLHHISQAKGAQ